MQPHLFIVQLLLTGLDFLNNTTLIAHEFFHIFDPGLPLFFSGSAYETNWNNSNPPNFEYGENCGISGLTIAHTEGFINEYSKCKPAEDRAVVFSFLYTRNNVVQNLLETDSFLNGKAEFIKELVSQYGFDL